MFAGALALSLSTGFGMGFQAPTNAALSKCVGNAQATLMNFAVGLFTLAVLTAILGSGNVMGFVQQPVWQWAGGLYGAFGVLFTAIVTPVLGVGLTMAASMLGQMTSGVLIDARGLLQAKRIPLEKLRIAGIALIALGVIVVCIGR